MSNVQAVTLKRKNSNGKYTQEEVQEMIDTRWGGGLYKLVSPYVNKKTKLKLYCTKHKAYFEKYLYQMQRNGTCPQCTKENIHNKKRKSNAEIEKIIGNNFSLVGDYTSELGNCTVKHNICGNTFTRKGGVLLKGNLKCPYCEKVHKLTSHEFAFKFNSILGTEFELMSKYTGSSNKVTVKHLKCGSIWKVEAGKFISERGGCPYCSNTLVKTSEQYNTELLKNTFNQYTLVGEYKNSYTKVIIKHLACGNTWSIRPKDFNRGYRCPFCDRSNGEKIISDYLDNHEISYCIQKKFYDCKDKGLLPFDFYVQNKVLIEFQGKQHYQRVMFFYRTDKAYLDARRRDRIKAKWAKDRGIVLLTIPYNYIDKIDFYLDNNLIPLLKRS